jgi:hypothetical protein
MDDTKRRRKDAVTCSNRCRKALSRDAKHHEGSNYFSSGSVTSPGAPYFDPPRPSETGSYGAWLSGERFREQYARHAATSQPLTEEERDLLARQRRNPGVLLPELHQRLIDIEAERREREAAETSHARPLKVEDPFDPSSQGSLARRAIASRNANRHRVGDPSTYVLRPGHQPGPHPLG